MSTGAQSSTSPQLAKQRRLVQEGCETEGSTSLSAGEEVRLFQDPELTTELHAIGLDF